YGIKPSPGAKQQLMENPSIMNLHMTVGEREIGGFSWLSVAASVVTVGSMIISIYFWNQWQTSDKQLSLLKAEKEVIANNYQQANQQLEEVKSDIAVLVSPAFSRLILQGTDNSPDAQAVIYWNKEEQAVLLNSASLTALNENQQYQLWALLDGQPIDAGIFDAQSGQFQMMKDIAAADAFAITIEPKGGSENPTLETMQVYGESS
ncbi:MAG: anti-sigma factor, partial [Cyclobacteriaceae bacterium]